MDNKLKLYNANFREGYWEELQELTNEKNTMQDFFSETNIKNLFHKIKRHFL